MQRLIDMKRLIDNINVYYPFITRDAVEYNLVSYNELLVTTSHGENFLYNDIKKSFRLLSSDYDISKDSFSKEFGLKLARLMEARYISEVELSDMTGISVQTISRYINGRIIPTFYNVYLISLALDCSLDDFIYRRKKL